MKLFDLETNGLLPTVTKVHCLVIKDRTTGQKYRCIPAGFPMKADMTIEEGLELLKSGPIGGHNVIKFDLAVLQKLYPDFTYDKAQVFDTLVATRLIFTNLKDIDAGLLKKKRLPGSLFGSHKLEAWGYRLGLQKGEYVADFKVRMGDAYVEGSEWHELSPEMLDYCDLDVEVTDALFSKIEAKEYSPLALEIEHQIAWLMAQQVRNGFPFDAAKGAELYAKLAQRRGELERALKDEFTFWFAPDGGVITPKLGNKTRGTVAGVPYQKIKVVEFNPSSRDHIADRLIKLYGWVPEVFTDGGKPKVDDEVMAKLDYPPAPLITEFLMVQKRISQLAEGDQAWLKVEQGGFIYGSINPNGAVTGRATHAYPNVAQVPAVGAPYGFESRSLFGVESIRHIWPEAVQVGADASGLELRCLAHFMARYDGGKYGDVLLNGDIHWANVQSMGLTDEARDESNKLHKVYRDGGKTFIYGFLKSRGCTQGWVQKTV
ncbi:DNA polymerase [Ralstonia phage BOESR1]|uniref:DNA polymerase n=1 Tax=Ralstonia phage BOESR1 TaxID=3034917 RepID=A0AA50F2S1_9CAUD|nr:DNA polymerase [Ralstonia phage BOESR1]WLW40594.1 DNA polymerase [Ralstonia phage BOESR1]